ncbi:MULTISPECIES: cytochrome c maturation protein CcmE [unclassified Anabaena]|uniref:cytochrome c maturation protein CcmE domain-containing protein n=1 Tax=unclassified Anabaena TaxID=2619674 RepID=UPI000A47E23D|nr:MULTISPECIES: cytochrome c maturation protein CcmE [unclassified Anabaena]
MTKLVSFMQKVQNFYLGFTLLCVVGLCSCAPLNVSGWETNNISFAANVTPIRELKSKADKKQTVRIQGTVEKQVPLVQRWAYMINDSTGTVWVVSNKNNFTEGQSVVIKGKVLYKSIAIADQDFGEVYLEQE